MGPGRDLSIDRNTTGGQANNKEQKTGIQKVKKKGEGKEGRKEGGREAEGTIEKEKLNKKKEGGEAKKKERIMSADRLRQRNKFMAWQPSQNARVQDLHWKMSSRMKEV